MLIDTHAHVVADDEKRYPLRPFGLRDADASQQRAAGWHHEARLTTPGLLAAMDAAGVDRALLVQAMSAYGYDNSYAADSAALHPDRFASVGIVDPDAADPAAQLAYWVEERGVRGARLFGWTGSAAIGPDDPRLVPLWESARKLSVPVVLFVLPELLPNVGRALARFSDLPVALDHCGFPNESDGSPFDRASELLALATAPNLHLKITSRVLEPIERSGRDPQEWVELLAEHFGPERLMWGSDFPATHTRDYAAYADLARRSVRAFSESERERILSGTALALWPAL